MDEVRNRRNSELTVNFSRSTIQISLLITLRVDYKVKIKEMLRLPTEGWPDVPFLHRGRDTVVRDQAGTMLQEENRQDGCSGREIGRNGIRDWDLEEQLHLGSERASRRIFRNALVPEIVKQRVEPSARTRKATGHCWGVCILRNEEETAHKSKNWSCSTDHSRIFRLQRAEKEDGGKPGSISILCRNKQNPWGVRNGDTSIGYSWRVALRRQQCGIFALSNNCGSRETTVTGEQLGKHVPAERDTRATEERRFLRGLCRD
jgi:hypothetical protein